MLRPGIQNHVIQEPLPVEFQRAQVQRHEDGGPQRIGFVGHGQGERITRHGHQIHSAILSLAQPVLHLSYKVVNRHAQIN